MEGEINESPFIFADSENDMRFVSPLQKSEDHPCYFIADPFNSPSHHVVARGRYTDKLILCDNAYTKFTLIYETRTAERIFFVSVEQSKPWYLIVLMRFGDGIDFHTNYCSIFVSKENDRTVCLPLSKKTSSPQLVSWAYQSESNLFLYTEFNDEVKIYKLNYNPAKCSYKITLQHEQGDYFTFRTGFTRKSQYCTLLSKSCGNKLKDCSKMDFSLKKQINLPKSFRIAEKDDIIICRIQNKQFNSLQYSSQRYILITNANVLFVILPASQYFMQIPLDYLPKNENQQKKDLEMVRSKINFDPINAQFQPYSKLPLSFFANDFLMIGAPKGYLTSVLVDIKNNPRIVIQTKIPDSELFIHSLSSFTKTCKYVLNQYNGEILSISINPIYLIKQDPHFIILIMHYINLKKELHLFPGYLVEETLKLFWNCEIFNELLLLLHNLYLAPKNQIENKVILENVGSTFSKYYSNINTDNNFHRYDSRGTVIETPDDSITQTHIYNSFQSLEINKLFPQETFNYLSLSLFIDIIENQNKIRTEIKNDPFDFNSYAKEIQYPVMLQLSALKHIFYLNAGKPLSNNNYPFFDFSIFPKNLPTPIYSYWNANNLLHTEQIPSNFKEEYKQFQKELFSYRINLRNDDIEIQQDDLSLQSIFYSGIEKTINRTEETCVNSYHSLIQKLYGMSYTDPIYEV